MIVQIEVVTLYRYASISGTLPNNMGGSVSLGGSATPETFIIARSDVGRLWWCKWELSNKQSPTWQELPLPPGEDTMLGTFQREAQAAPA